MIRLGIENPSSCYKCPLYDYSAKQCNAAPRCVEYINGKQVNCPIVEEPTGVLVNTCDEDEWYGRIFKCGECEAEIMGDSASFCPECGVKFTRIVDKHAWEGVTK